MRDRFGRQVHYLRLSVTDRCDFRCSDCLSLSHRDFATPADWLSAAEIGRIVGLFCGLGMRHVRLTGGEPLAHRELLEILRTIATTPGIEDLSLSTNASRDDEQPKHPILEGIANKTERHHFTTVPTAILRPMSVHGA
jgi:cyclic pyranopterin phosphate synthase